jgi:hypothetical protein
LKVGHPAWGAERHLFHHEAALTLPGAAAHTLTLMGTSQGSAPNSIFRIVALVTSAVATILFVLCAAAIARYGDRIRDFGWTPDRVNGRLVVARVDPGGPADSLLQAGDAIVAWDGDPRIARAASCHSVAPFRLMLVTN